MSHMQHQLQSHPLISSPGAQLTYTLGMFNVPTAPKPLSLPSPPPALQLTGVPGQQQLLLPHLVEQASSDDSNRSTSPGGIEFGTASGPSCNTRLLRQQDLAQLPAAQQQQQQQQMVSHSDGGQFVQLVAPMHHPQYSTPHFLEQQQHGHTGAAVLVGTHGTSAGLLQAQIQHQQQQQHQSLTQQQGQLGQQQAGQPVVLRLQQQLQPVLVPLVPSGGGYPAGAVRVADIFSPQLSYQARAALEQQLQEAYASGFADGVEAGRRQQQQRREQQQQREQHQHAAGQGAAHKRRRESTTSAAASAEEPPVTKLKTDQTPPPPQQQQQQQQHVLKQQSGQKPQSVSIAAMLTGETAGEAVNLQEAAEQLQQLSDQQLLQLAIAAATTPIEKLAPQSPDLPSPTATAAAAAAVGMMSPASSGGSGHSSDGCCYALVPPSLPALPAVAAAGAATGAEAGAADCAATPASKAACPLAGTGSSSGVQADQPPAIDYGSTSTWPEDTSLQAQWEGHRPIDDDVLSMLQLSGLLDF